MMENKIIVDNQNVGNRIKGELLERLFIRTKNELEGYFTEKETMFLVVIFNGLLYIINDIWNKSLLEMQALDAIELHAYDIMYGIDKDELMDKIEQLTEFQAFVVTMLAVGY